MAEPRQDTHVGLARELMREPSELFALLALERGLIQAAHVEECLHLLEREGFRRPLYEVLVERGYLDPKVATRLLDPDTPQPMPAEAAAHVDDPARRLGKFVLLEEIGVGVAGSVVRAWDTELHRWVAIKLPIRPGQLQKARFLKEAQVAARLAHPGIVTVHEIGEREGSPYIVMQFVDGRSLKGVHLRPREAADAVRRAAEAVAYAHRQGVIHRDLKPGNILRDKQDCIYVADFGLARDVDAGVTLTAAGSPVGTPAYMSPEQVTGRRDAIDARSDVYGLGATLYELLTGRPPFRGATIAEVFHRVLNSEPVPPRTLQPDIDPRLETICFRAIEKEKARRYPTAAALAEDLRRYLAGEPVRARAPSTWYTLRRRLAKRRGLVATALAALLLGAAVATIVVLPLWREDARKTERELAALKRLGSLWTQVVLAKQRLHNATNDPAQVRAEIARVVEEVSRYVAEHPDRPQGYYVRARGELCLGEVEKAEADLRAAVALDDSFAPGHALLGQAKLEEHFRRLYAYENSDTSQRSVELEPLLREAQDSLAKAAQHERASVEKWGLTRTREDEVAAVVQRALIAAYVDRDVPKAIGMLEANAGESEEYCTWLGVWATTLEERIRWQTQALEKMPHFWKARFDRAIALHKQGHLEAAIADFDKAIELNPCYAVAYNSRGVSKLEGRDFDGAIADYTHAIAIDPKYALAYTNRGNVRRAKGDLDGAFADHDRAIELNPRSAVAWNNRGVAKGDRRDFDGAIADHDRAIELDPRYAVAWNNRGCARLAKGDPEGARDDLSKAVEIRPGYAEAYHNRSLAHQAMGDTDAAIADQTRVIDINPSFAGAYYLRGITRHRKGDLDGAISDYGKMIEINPRDADAHYNRASARYAKGDFDGAIADYTQAIEINASSAQAWVNRGAARQTLGDIDGAIADYNKGIEVDPRHAAAYSNRGAARQTKGDLDGALQDYAKAIELDPRNPETWSNRGAVRRWRGDRAGAIADYEKALDAAPAGWSVRDRVAKALRELKSDAKR